MNLISSALLIPNAIATSTASRSRKPYASESGQPFLVNRLAQLLTQDIGSDDSQPISQANLNYALAKLVNENNTHKVFMEELAFVFSRAKQAIVL